MPGILIGKEKQILKAEKKDALPNILRVKNFTPKTRYIVRRNDVPPTTAI